MPTRLLSTVLVLMFAVMSESEARAQVRFRLGNSNVARPPFARFQPGAGANFGFASRRVGGGFRVNVSAEQGSSRSFGSVAPSIVLPQGGYGSIQSARWRPFVTGVTPFVARSQPQIWQPAAVARAANRGGEPEESKAAKQNRIRNERRMRVIDRLARKAEHEKSKGRIGMARMYYRMALKRTSDGDEVQQSLSAKMAELQ